MSMDPDGAGSMGSPASATGTSGWPCGEATDRSAGSWRYGGCGGSLNLRGKDAAYGRDKGPEVTPHL